MRWMHYEMNVTIRDAVDGDCERLVELGHPIAIDYVRPNLAKLVKLGLTPLVADVDGLIVGLCVPSIMQTLHRETPVGRISTMVVSDDRRSQGIGALLVAEAERRLIGQGCALIEVTSNEARARAHNFWRAQGYEHTSKRFAKKV
nr:GNAT family N-acetyltransferase [uncultured Sphingomonas sp.]